MIAYDFNGVVDNHEKQIIPYLFAKFEHATDETIAELSAKYGYIIKKFEDPIIRNTQFIKQIQDNYTASLDVGRQMVFDLFRRNGLEFRLYDIIHAIHQFQRVTLIWVVGTDEYNFDFRFPLNDDETDPGEYMYKLNRFDGFGNVTHGDLISETVKMFDTDVMFPDWFVNGLARNS